MPIPHRLVLSLCVLALSLTPRVIADEGDAPAADSNQAASVTEVGPAQRNAEEEEAARDVMEQLLQQKREAPVVQPTRDPEVAAQPSRVGAPAATVDLDPTVVGIAPGGEPPKLLPEGTFLVSRRGRLARSADGAHVLFTFEADGPDTPEAPMILLPCRKLQDMEDYVEKHGDQTVFSVSGEIHIYRGANYLMPTMMVIDIDRGNLEN